MGFFICSRNTHTKYNSMSTAKYQGWKENFGMIIPTDICRHLDGTPISYVSPLDKEDAIKYIKESVGIDYYEKMTGAEKEKIISEWRVANNIDINKPLYNVTHNSDGSKTFELNK